MKAKTEKTVTTFSLTDISVDEMNAIRKAFAKLNWTTCQELGFTTGELECPCRIYDVIDGLLIAADVKSAFNNSL